MKLAIAAYGVVNVLHDDTALAALGLVLVNLILVQLLLLHSKMYGSRSLPAEYRPTKKQTPSRLYSWTHVVAAKDSKALLKA